MPTTPKGLPYPSGSATPDVPRDIAALAVELDDRVCKAKYVTTASVTVSGSPAAGTVVVNFPAGLFSSAPRVWLQVANSSLYIAYISVAPTTGQVTIGARHVDAASASATITVNVLAEEWA